VAGEGGPALGVGGLRRLPARLRQLRGSCKAAGGPAPASGGQRHGVVAGISTRAITSRARQHGLTVALHVRRGVSVSCNKRIWLVVCQPRQTSFIPFIKPSPDPLLPASLSPPALRPLRPVPTTPAPASGPAAPPAASTPAARSAATTLRAGAPQTSAASTYQTSASRLTAARVCAWSWWTRPRVTLSWSSCLGCAWRWLRWTATRLRLWRPGARGVTPRCTI
jgi:hypothetical protein